MPSYGMVIDLNKCNGCYNCFLACRDEHYNNDFPPYALSQPFRGHFWMRVIERERGQYPRVKVAYLPKPCFHCDSAPCIKAATGGAVYKRADGIVIIDPERSSGQKQIVSACPHRVIFWNEEKNIPQKCTLCAHLLDQGWREPRCVEACPTGALVFGDLEDPRSGLRAILAEKGGEELHPEYNLEPRVRYVGLPKRFLAGTVIFGDSDECAEGVNVILRTGSSETITRTNNFGDFEFESPEVGESTLIIQHDHYYACTLVVNLKTDIDAGEIVLQKK